MSKADSVNAIVLSINAIVLIANIWIYYTLRKGTRSFTYWRHYNDAWEERDREGFLYRRIPDASQIDRCYVYFGSNDFSGDRR